MIIYWFIQLMMPLTAALWQDTYIHVWDVRTGAKTATLHGHLV